MPFTRLCQNKLKTFWLKKFRYLPKNMFNFSKDVDRDIHLYLYLFSLKNFQGQK